MWIGSAGIGPLDEEFISVYFTRDNSIKLDILLPGAYSMGNDYNSNYIHDRRDWGKVSSVWDRYVPDYCNIQIVLEPLCYRMHQYYLYAKCFV